MDGMGWVITSSPTSSVTGWPASLYAHAATPSSACWISPAVTGRLGAQATKPEAMSVPPLMEASQTSGFTAVYTHR